MFDSTNLCSTFHTFSFSPSFIFFLSLPSLSLSLSFTKSSPLAQFLSVRFASFAYQPVRSSISKDRVKRESKRERQRKNWKQWENERVKESENVWMGIIRNTYCEGRKRNFVKTGLIGVRQRETREKCRKSSEI